MSSDLLVISVIILFSAIIPVMLKKFKLPIVFLEILIGIFLGQTIFKHYPLGDSILFIGEMGFLFLLFLGGLEIEVDFIRKKISHILILAAVAYTIPLIVGFLIGFVLYDVWVGLFVGSAFSASSIGVAIPVFKSRGLLHKEIGKIAINAAVLNDIATILTLAILIELREGIGQNVALVLLKVVITLIVIIIALFITHVKARGVLEAPLTPSITEGRVRLALSILAAFIILCIITGVDPLVGAFFSGIIVAETTQMGSEIRDKLSAMGFAFLIPVFFVTLGAQMELITIFTVFNELVLFSVIVILAILSEFLSVYSTCRLLHYGKGSSKLISISMSARLSIGLAVAEVGIVLGIFDIILFSTILLMTVLTTILVPLMTQVIHGEFEFEDKNIMQEGTMIIKEEKR